MDFDQGGETLQAEYLISVITICRNASKTIDATLQSVATQINTAGLVEHLVIDGASDDDTLAIVKRYPNVRWISEPDEGISDAFNKGAYLANGDYLLYLNADDYLVDDEVLYDVSQFIQSNHAPDWIVGDVVESRNEEFTIPPRRYPPSCWSLMFRNRIGHQSVFLKRYVLLESGGFEKRFKTAMDYDLFERLCANGCKPFYIPRVIAVFSKEGLTSVSTPDLVSETQEVSRRFRNTPLKRFVGKAYDRLRGGS